MGYFFRLAARVLLYAPSHRQDSINHGLSYTSRGALAGTRNRSMSPPHEGSIRRPQEAGCCSCQTVLGMFEISISYTYRRHIGENKNSLQKNIFVINECNIGQLLNIRSLYGRLTDRPHGSPFQLFFFFIPASDQQLAKPRMCFAIASLWDDACKLFLARNRTVFFKNNHDVL